MNPRSILLPLTLIVILLAACTPSESLPEPTPIPLIETSSIPRSPTSAPSFSGNCQMNRTYLDSIAASLPFEQVMISHQSYAGEQSLVIWLVSPAISSTAGEQNQAVAEQQAILTAKALADAYPCLLQIQTMHLTVVDVEYRQWFSGSLRIIDLPNLPTDQIGGGTETEQGGGREAQPLNTLPAVGSDACTWQDAGSLLRSDFSSRQVEAAFSFVRDAGGNIVYAQWSVPDQDAALDVLDDVLAIAGQVSCLYPPVTGIAVLLTLPDGQTLLSGFLPIDPTQGVDSSLFSFDFIAQP